MLIGINLGVGLGGVRSALGSAVVHWGAVSDDGRLPRGAVAPRGRRAIRSGLLLDVLWALVPATGFTAVSQLSLVTVRDGSLRTGDGALRAAGLWLPLAAGALAVVGGLLRRPAVVAAATGALAPSVAVVGAVSGSLFVDRDAAYADAGVAVALVAATLGAVSLVRWFTYHPAGDGAGERRPPRWAAGALGAAGAAGAIAVVATALGATSLGAGLVVPVAFALCAPLTVLGAAIARTTWSSTLAACAAAAQVAATVAAWLDDVERGTAVTAWTGAIGLVALGASAVAAVTGVVARTVDAERAVDDDPAWRWTADD